MVTPPLSNMNVFGWWCLSPLCLGKARGAVCAWLELAAAEAVVMDAGSRKRVAEDLIVDGDVRPR